MCGFRRLFSIELFCRPLSEVRDSCPKEIVFPLENDPLREKNKWKPRSSFRHCFSRGTINTWCKVRLWFESLTLLVWRRNGLRTPSSCRIWNSDLLLDLKSTIPTNSLFWEAIIWSLWHFLPTVILDIGNKLNGTVRNGPSWFRSLLWVESGQSILASTQLTRFACSSVRAYNYLGLSCILCERFPGISGL